MLHSSTSAQEPSAPSGTEALHLAERDSIPDSVSNKNQVIEDLNDLFKGGDGGATFKGQTIAPLGIDVVQSLKNIPNIGMVLVLNLFMLCSIIGILHDVMPNLGYVIIPFLDGMDLTQWTNDLIMAAGKLTTAKKAQDKFPEAFKKAQEEYASFQTILNQIAKTASLTTLMLISTLEIFLEAVMNPEGLAGFLDHQGMNIYIACAKVIIEIKEDIYYGYCVFVPFGAKNNWIIASLSMILPGNKVSRKDIEMMMSKHRYIYAVMRELFYGIPPQGDDDRLSAFRYGIHMMVQGCRQRHIDTVMIAATTHAELVGSSYDESVKGTCYACTQLRDSGIKALITRPLTAIALNPTA